MPEYDKWYKDVLKGIRKCFYPRRIRLLENIGTFMFLFHVHHHGIVGEAQITKATVENGRYFYCFDEFLSYPHPVQLELLETDLRLPRIGRRGQWLHVYISEETIEEIRGLSKLPEAKRKKLRKGFEQIIEQLKEYPLHKPPKPWKLYMRDEGEKLKKEHRLDEHVLAKAQKYFSQLIQKKMSRGHSLDEVFYASLYLAFRMQNIPKMLEDITQISGVNPIKLGKLYRSLVREFDLIVPPLDPEQLLKSRADRLHLSGKTIRKAVSFIREVRKRGDVRGKAPSSIAAVATVFVCQKERKKISLERIAETFCTSTATIRNLSKELDADA